MSEVELKKRLFDLLRKDEEFRYAVAGLLGFEEIFKRLEAHDRKFEEIMEKLEAHDRKFEEHDRKFEEMKRLIELNRMDIGALTEAFFSWRAEESLKAKLASKGGTVTEVLRRKPVNGSEVDLIVIGDGEVYAVEVKIRPKKRDIDSLLMKSEILKREYVGMKVIPVIPGTWISKDVIRYAEFKGVRAEEF